MLTLVCAGTAIVPAGKLDGVWMPEVLATRPGGTNFISIGGRGSATSCQLLCGSLSPLIEARDRGSALLQDLGSATVSFINEESKRDPSNRSPGSAA